MSFEYTRNRAYPPVVRFFTNPTYGIDMNVAASFTGTPVVIHNGTDTTAWTATVEAGSSNRFDFASTDQAQAGTKSIDGTNSKNGNTALFSKGTGTISAASYVAVTGYIYITDWSTKGTVKRVDFGVRNNGTLQGNLVDIGSFVDTGKMNAWQKFVIPFSALGLSTETFDEMVVITMDEGAGAAPDYYLDSIQIEETGVPVVFKLEAPEGKLFTVWQIKFTFVAPWTAMTSDGAKPKIVYNKFMDLNELTHGLVLQDHRPEGIRFSATVKNNIDLVDLPVSTWRLVGYDETDAIVDVLVDFDGNTPDLIDDSTGSYNSVTITDDLSTFKHFRMSARGYVVESI